MKSLVLYFIFLGHIWYSCLWHFHQLAGTHLWIKWSWLGLETIWPVESSRLAGMVLPLCCAGSSAESCKGSSLARPRYFLSYSHWWNYQVYQVVYGMGTCYHLTPARLSYCGPLLGGMRVVWSVVNHDWWGRHCPQKLSSGSSWMRRSSGWALR